jgi:hypothetical protein
LKKDFRDDIRKIQNEALTGFCSARLSNETNFEKAAKSVSLRKSRNSNKNIGIQKLLN